MLARASRASFGRVRFDAQARGKPGIGGVAYRQGELRGYEIGEYLPEKWGVRVCLVRGGRRPVADRAHPPAFAQRIRLGPNLTLAGETCNRQKDSQPVDVCLKRKPEVLRRVPAHARRALAASAAVDTAHWRMVSRLARTGLPFESPSDGRIKWNRTRLGLPKTHSPDAVCVGSLEAVPGANRLRRPGGLPASAPDRHGLSSPLPDAGQARAGFQT
ncbi:MAG: HNH endonuclease, partial [Alphaproteobacteria bacterium]|nr:HNH endonuclease [Alphaproteobacteria bacterium]